MTMTLEYRAARCFSGSGSSFKAYSHCCDTNVGESEIESAFEKPARVDRKGPIHKAWFSCVVGGGQGASCRRGAREPTTPYAWLHPPTCLITSERNAKH
ncbi:hypothetical protein M404DRAFT_1008415 [Pisolithus tinctorius Marx 270]|uniref:Uncharacterized protein n=1 Tax=Pisolithus tinctorius Marx 270 TaxID=870435 RepID=A0A0C3IBC5_PISTI|nr:hypothetical protein M404DRAFT_1008415 [Pisolithus tinctorius Marx 270]